VHFPYCLSLNAFPQVLLIAVVPILVARRVRVAITLTHGTATMLAISVWFIASFAVGLFANALGRSGAIWILFSLILSPSLGLIVVAVLDKKRARPARAMATAAPVAIPV
jgi:hypothetical protein